MSLPPKLFLLFAASLAAGVFVSACSADVATDPNAGGKADESNDPDDRYPRPGSVIPDDVRFDPEDNLVFFLPQQELPADQAYFTVEIPSGGTNKYEFRTATGQVVLDRRLCSRPMVGKPGSVHGYPASYGVMAGRFAVDGDPLDLVVIGSEPTYKLMVENQTVQPRAVRVLANMRMQECDEKQGCNEDQWVDDPKIVAVDVEDSAVGVATSLSELEILRPGTRASLEDYFSNYKGPGEKTNGDKFPQTRVQSFSDLQGALDVVASLEVFDPASRDEEIADCTRQFSALLNDKDQLSQEPRPEISKGFVNCLTRVFHRPFFESVENFEFFLDYSAYQLLGVKLLDDSELAEVTQQTALASMADLRANNDTHYRFAGYDDGGTGQALFEWIKTKNRNKGCAPDFPQQHYESDPLINVPGYAVHLM